MNRHSERPRKPKQARQREVLATGLDHPNVGRRHAKRFGEFLLGVAPLGPELADATTHDPLKVRLVPELHIPQRGRAARAKTYSLRYQLGMRGIGLFLAAGSTVLGCTVPPASDEFGSGGAPNCIPGSQAACSIPNSCTGIQVCTPDGHGYGPCDCGDAGLGGTGGTAAGGAGGAGAYPNFVNIELISILAGPGKVDGTQWDSSDNVPPEVWEGLASALGLPGVGALFDFMESAAAKSLNKPDPVGVAELDWTGNGFDPLFEITLSAPDDTFLPIWEKVPGKGMPGWHNVPYAPGVKVRLTLRDEDLVTDDDMGICTLDGEDIAAAWQNGGTFWVRVETQTQKQVLAVALQVTAGG